MKTQIFKNRFEFNQRTDWSVNGVTQDFADLHPDYEKQNETNEACWNCSDCSGCSRCSDCSGCSRCSRCSGCSDCSGCSGCSDCSRCSRCSDCSDCSGCSDCSDCSGCSDCSRCSRCSDLKNAAPVEQSGGLKNGFPEVPVIENIHQKVFDAISSPGANLEMDSWHKCDTTHCRAGWVVHLAGEAGRELEIKTSTPFAAMQIYHKSSPIQVSPVRFYEDNKVALADIERCAKLEKGE